MSLFSAAKKSWISEHRFRESLPYFAIWYFEAGTVRRIGWLDLPNGSTIEYRLQRKNKLVHLRVSGIDSQWRSVNIVRTRKSMRRRQLECPHCCTQTSLIYAIGPRRGHWRCDTCCPLPSVTQHPQRYQRHIREGNLMPLAIALQKRGKAAIDARVAMEREGLAPSTLSVRKHTKRECVRTADHRLISWKPSDKMKTIRSVGRLLYVEGRLHVR